MTSTAVGPPKMNVTESKSTQNSSGNPNRLESLLKEVYRMHKQIVKSSSHVWKDKFDKTKAMKTKISESKKSLQREYDALKVENKALKETQKSYLKLTESCRNCEDLRLSLTTLRESFQKSFDEKDKLIQHLSNQLSATFRDQSCDSSSTKLSLDNEKHNRLRLKTFQKKVIYTQEEGDKLSQPIDGNNCSSDQECGKIFVPDTVEVPAVGDKTSQEICSLAEKSLCPQSLLFSNCSSESESDSGDNKNKHLDNQKLFVFESPNLQEATRSVSPTFTSNKKLISSKTLHTSPVLVPSPTTDVSLGHNDMDENQIEAYLSTNSPRRKKRRTLTQFQKVLKEDFPKKSSLLLCNTQNIVTPSKSQSSRLTTESRRKQKIDKKENCSQNPFSPADPDKTVPPECWNNTTVIPHSQMNDILTEPSSEHIGNNNWSRNNASEAAKELVTGSLRRNGSLDPSMCMTEFLLQNEELANSKPAEKMVSQKSGFTKRRCIEELLIVVPSDSYRFEDGKPELVANSDKRNPVSEDNNRERKQPDTQDNNCSIADSYDSIKKCQFWLLKPCYPKDSAIFIMNNTRPQKEDLPYAYDAVVRKKHERKLLNGYTCEECVEYYRAKGLSGEEINKQIGDCSRHRAKYKPPNTPQHFWSIGFPDTEECEKRGYLTTETKPLPSRGKKHEKERNGGDKNCAKKENKECGMTQLLDYLDHGSEEVDD